MKSPGFLKKISSLSMIIIFSLILCSVQAGDDWPMDVPLTSTTHACPNNIDGCPPDCPCEDKVCPLPDGGGGKGGNGGNSGGTRDEIHGAPPEPDGNRNQNLPIPPFAMGSLGSSSSAADPIDPGRDVVYLKRTDVAIPIAGGLEFRLDRMYTSGRLMNTYTDNCHPMLGESWHLSIDARVFLEDGSDNLIILLPTSRPRLFEWNETDQKWYSDEAEGFFGEATWDDVNEEYELLYPEGDKLRFNKRGFLISWENSIGNCLTFDREIVTDNGKEYDRLDKVETPSIDGRYFEFYYNDDDCPWLLTKVIMKTTTDSSYSQVLIEYEYHTSTGNNNLLDETHYMGQNLGEYYNYGSGSEDTQGAWSNDMINGETYMRTLSEVGTYDESSNKSFSVGYTYEPKIGKLNNVEGWCEYRPISVWKPVFSSTNPQYILDICKSYTLDDYDIDQGYVLRVYRGDSNDEYVDYTSNDNRDIYKYEHSSNFSDMDYYATWNTNLRRLTETKDPSNLDNVLNSVQYDQSSGHLAKGNVTQRTDPMERSTGIQYDSTYNKPTQITDPYNRTKTIQYDSNTGLPTSITYPADPDYPNDARTISFSYNSYGNLTSKTDSVNGTTNYTYYATGATGSKSSSNGGLLASVTAPNGAVTSFEYNTLGYVTKVTSSDGLTIEYTYDGILLTEVNRDGKKQTYSYDDMTYRTSETDAAGHTTNYTYDGLGRLVEIEDAEGNTIEYDYNLYSQVTSIKDSKGNETTFEYDGMGRLEYETDEQNNQTQYVYGDSGCSSCGGSGKITKKVDPRGQTITYDYDSYGRISQIDYYAAGVDPETDPAQRTVSYEYNDTINSVETDNVTKITDSALPFSTKYYTYSYDSLGRKSLVNHPEGFHQAWDYNADGKVNFYRDADGGVSRYTYDSYQRLSKIEDAWGNETDFVYNTSSDYGPRSAIKEIQYENGTKAQYEYDSHGKLAKITNKASDGTVMTSFDYSYYKDGDISRIDLNDGDAWYYQYDKISQLTGEARLDSSDQIRWSRAYSYDSAGNRTYLDYYDGSTTDTAYYSYNALNQLTSDSTWDYSYDDNGNLIEKKQPLNCTDYETWDYDWTIDNRMEKVTYEYIDDVTTDMEYVYDINGSRILKRSLEKNNMSDGTRKRYFFNGLTAEVVKTSVDGAHSDTAFEYNVKEDGVSASNWDVYDDTPSGATVTSIEDTDLRSYVIKCDGQDGNGFVVGDNGSNSYNPNEGPWNETKKVMSFWYKGGFSPIYVTVSTSSGDKYLKYYSANGTSYEDGSGHVCFYLGTGADRKSVV